MILAAKSGSCRNILDSPLPTANDNVCSIQKCYNTRMMLARNVIAVAGGQACNSGKVNCELMTMFCAR